MGARSAFASAGAHCHLDCVKDAYTYKGVQEGGGLVQQVVLTSSSSKGQKKSAQESRHSKVESPQNEVELQPSQWRTPAGQRSTQWPSSMNPQGKSCDLQSEASRWNSKGRIAKSMPTGG